MAGKFIDSSNSSTPQARTMLSTSNSSSLATRLAFGFAILTAGANVSATAAIVASYDAGVSATAGVIGAANPTSQGWTSVGGVTAFSHGQDSRNGGWRITDGTSSNLFFYQRSFSATEATALQEQGWLATWTTAVNADAIRDTGSSNVNDYYSGTNNFGRQNNNSLWLESTGPSSFLYILTHRTNPAGDIIISDGTSNFQVTNTGGRLSQEIGTGSPSAFYVTYSLRYDASSNTATLTDSLGGNFGPISTSGTASQNRVVWGATSATGQGSTTWNQVQLSVTAVPEPSSVAIFSLAGLASLGYRRCRARERDKNTRN